MIARLSRQKTNRFELHFKSIVLTDIYRTFYQTTIEYKFFSNVHGTFSSIDHLLGNKASLKLEKIKVIPSIFSDHDSIKLEITGIKMGILQIRGN